MGLEQPHAQGAGLYWTRTPGPHQIHPHERPAIGPGARTVSERGSDRAVPGLQPELERLPLCVQLAGLVSPIRAGSTAIDASLQNLLNRRATTNIVDRVDSGDPGQNQRMEPAPVKNEIYPTLAEQDNTIPCGGYSPCLELWA